MTTTAVEKLEYSLAKQVPDLSRGFTINTTYGDITVEPGAWADCLRVLVEDMLKEQLLHARSQTATAALGPL